MTDSQDIPYGYCHCGCSEKTPLAKKTSRTRGYVEGEPLRFLPGHQTRLSPHEFLEDGNGCWVWQRSRVPEGYGKFTTAGRTYRAHRWYYKHLVGPIPDGLVLDHLCGDPACVNPGHLEPVTVTENVRRGRQTKLTDRQVAEIRSLCEEGWIRRDIGEAYGVSTGYVRHLSKGRGRV